MGLPAISLPNVKGKLLSRFVYSSDFNISFKFTLSLILFGTSIPTADFPGIGASILISDVAKLNAKSSAKLIILLTLTPGAG